MKLHSIACKKHFSNYQIMNSMHITGTNLTNLRSLSLRTPFKESMKMERPENPSTTNFGDGIRFLQFLARNKYKISAFQLTLFLIISSQILAFVSICTGACAPCFRPSTFVFTFALFISSIISILAFVIYIRTKLSGLFCDGWRHCLLLNESCRHSFCARHGWNLCKPKI